MRTPASLNPESLKHFQTDHWVTLALFAAIAIAFAFASFIGLRRLQIAGIWTKNLSERGYRTENEILYAIGNMMFPIRMWLGGLMVLSFASLTVIKTDWFTSVVNFGCLSMLLVFLYHLNREQKLVFRIRKIDPRNAKANTVALRIFSGVTFGMLTGFALASLLTAVRTTLIPLTGSVGSFIQILEFCGALIFSQLLLSPLVMRMMLPSRKATTEIEVRTAKTVTDAFAKLGLREPQVRILNLDGLRTYNALIAGVNSAPGPFRQIVMISQSSELELSEKETSAIIHHELAHGFLLHIPVRLVASMAIWLMGMLPVFALTLFVDEKMAGALAPALLMFYFLIVHPLILGRLVREQEIQADEFAVTRLGSSHLDLVSALAKATLASGSLLDRKPAGCWMNAAAAHPTVLEREALLQRLENPNARDSENLSRARAVKRLFSDRLWQSAAALNLAVVLVFVTVSALESNSELGPATMSQSRTPASIEATLNDLETRKIEKIKVLRTESLDHVAL